MRFQPVHERRTKIEADTLVVVDDFDDLLIRAENTGSRILPVTFLRDPGVPVVVRIRRILQLDVLQPRILSGWLIEMSVYANVFIHPVTSLSCVRYKMGNCPFVVCPPQASYETTAPSGSQTQPIAFGASKKRLTASLRAATAPLPRFTPLPYPLRIWVIARTPRCCRSFRTRTASLPSESLKVPMIQQLSAARNLAAVNFLDAAPGTPGEDSSLRRVQDGDTIQTVLIDSGYQGFNMFKMNPGARTARREVQSAWPSSRRKSFAKPRRRHHPGVPHCAVPDKARCQGFARPNIERPERRGGPAGSCTGWPRSRRKSSESLTASRNVLVGHPHQG